jgi:hypothetical protein
MNPLAKPWYREPWPWLLMAGPVAVVLAGIATTVLAVTSFDGLVADDYYKQGLGINRVIAREAKAQAMGLDAAVQFNPERTRIRVVLGTAAHPRSIKVALVHPTRPDADQAITLAASAGGTYEGAMKAPRAPTMQVRIEDGEGQWRLAGSWSTKHDSVKLAP